MNRRSFLLSIPALYCARLIAAPATHPRLLVVFLRGGYDAANTLVPVSSADYYDMRPTIAVPRDAALALDADWGLHPALGESLLPLYRRGEAAFVPFCGTSNLSRSHFETQDAIELGQPDGARSYASGFLNRLASTVGGGRAVSFTNQLPLALRGEAQVANIAVGQPAMRGLDARERALVEGMYRGTPLAAQVSEGFATREDAMSEAQNARVFSERARTVARLMRADYRIGFIDIGGWDTHAGEGGEKGLLAARLGDLGKGLASFAQEMGPAWRETVVVVLSEFGRTFRENGSRGTDHGHGTAYWILSGGLRGGASRGGRVAGEQVRVSRATLNQDRDFPVLNDYRSVLGGLFGRMYGLDASRIARVFPGAPAADLALI